FSRDWSSDVCSSDLINVVGLADSGIGVLAPSKDNLVTTVGQLAPTTALLHKYHPSLTCTLLGAKWFIDNGGAQAEGGNGYSIVQIGRASCRERAQER